MKSRLIVCTAVLCLAPALAVGGDIYKIDAGHSNIGFGVKHMAVSTVRGVFLEYEGSADVALDSMADSSVEISISAASVETNQDGRDDHLRSADFFDVENHPDITFMSKSIAADGDDYVITGDLTIRGTTREVDMPVEVSGPIQDPWGNSRIGVSGVLTIDRTDFGLTYNNVLETGGLVVGKEVKITIDVELVRSGEE